MHDPDQPCIAEALLDLLIPALIRSGDVSEATILTLADDMDHEAQTASIERGEELERMSLALRGYALEAAGPKLSETQADRRRKRFRVFEDKP